MVEPAPVSQSDAVDEASQRLSPQIAGAVMRFGRFLRHVVLRRGLSGQDVGGVLQARRGRLGGTRSSGETSRALGVSYVYRTAVAAALEVVRQRRAGAGVRGVAAERQGREGVDRA